MYQFLCYAKNIYGDIMKGKLKNTFLLFLFSVIALNLIITSNILNNKEKKEDILRLHVVANSNSTKDQIIKLKIYEKVNNYISNLSKIYNDKNIITRKVIDNKSIISGIINNVLTEENVNYGSTLKVGFMHYDKKESVLLDMQEGNYNSINITLGNGNGKNIWSLIMPSKEDMENISNLDTIIPGISNIYEKNNNTNEKYCFKIVEIINKIKNNK